MSRKLPLFNDLTSGLMGTFVKIIPASEGMVRVAYKPFGLKGLFGTKITKRTYPVEAVFPVPLKEEEDGMITDQIVAVEDSSGARPFLDNIGVKLDFNIRMIKEEKENKDLALAREKIRSRKNLEDTKKIVADDREITRQRLPSDSPEARLGFGIRDRWRGYSEGGGYDDQL